MSCQYQKSPLSVAPMMRYTNRYLRYMLRQISSNTLLYTEMVTAAALIHADPDRFLEFDELEHPLVLQLGSDSAADMGKASKIALGFGYRELNINVGCPSDRVQSGNFGACLMATPHLVADIYKSMTLESGLPVSIKTRIGIDNFEEYSFLKKFVEVNAKAGCGRFIIHARKAILDGLSPEDNRKIPPLKYDYVYRLKNDFPELIIEINGGIRDFETATTMLAKVDGVMLGRAVTENPWVLHSADETFYNGALSTTAATQKELVLSMMPKVKEWLSLNLPVSAIMQPFLLLFKGVPGGRAYRRYLSESRNDKTPVTEKLYHALDLIS